jgi:aldehyde dehydrogenase (NAD+)
VTARRICWGKFANAGQICIAPDYLLVTHDMHDALVAEMCAALKEFYGEDPSASPDFPRIVSDLHTQRLAALITDNGSQSSEGGNADFKVACGGLHTANLAARYLPPTLLVDVAHTAKVMGMHASVESQ